ncbi:MAG: hypothetical protein DCC67_12550 [Planctomycetota bacterium]|nr:MAG: hypothetical protein DCC67_12550 [Planctomycetota bacterium]
MPLQWNWLRKRCRDAVSYRLRTWGDGRWASYCRPTWISFLITERCNARCVHCNIWQNRGPEDSPTFEQWCAALLDLRRWLGPMHVCITGGEALLKPFTPELVAYGSSLGAFVEVLTHGYWKDQSRIERLALANPWRITVSLDGVDETHDEVRGREGFVRYTRKTLETLLALRRARRLRFSIRLKTVVMARNLHALEELAEFATQDGVDILFQPIERNYNSPDDPHWYLHSANWPQDPAAAVRSIERLIELKRDGRAIANTVAELRVMQSYFLDPEGWQVSVKTHTSHERRAACTALNLFQAQSNGDVRVCCCRDPVGNIKTARPRDIWRNRPHWWADGCCMDSRMSTAEKEHRLVT